MTAMPARLQPVVQAVLRAVNAMSAPAAPRSAAGGAGRAPKADTGRRSRQPAAKDEDPGLVLISRRPPQQKFTNFEEYMNAHGGATAPIEDHSDEV